MSKIEERGDTRPGDRRLLGVPGWAWAAGLAIGFGIGLILFDEVLLGVVFGVSIGTAFALAFGSSGTATEAGLHPPAPGEDNPRP